MIVHQSSRRQLGWMLSDRHENVDARTSYQYRLPTNIEYTMLLISIVSGIVIIVVIRIITIIIIMKSPPSRSSSTDLYQTNARSTQSCVGRRRSCAVGDNTQHPAEVEKYSSLSPSRREAESVASVKRVLVGVHRVSACVIRPCTASRSDPVNTFRLQKDCREL